MAIAGMEALTPTLQAIHSGKTIGLANKEILVSAGELITQLARDKGVFLIPIDSEHSALFQCLEGKKPHEVRRLILTASGGPFRTFSKERLAQVTLEETLRHPTWNMGKKITVDSSTLMNKGLEMIEAYWLFQVPLEKIDVIIHPQSIVHSFVEFVDGTLLAQLSPPDMWYPVQYALTYPERKKKDSPPFDFRRYGHLEFFPPDHAKFPTLRLAKDALEKGGSFPCYLNAINEVLVTRFLKRNISWQGIIQRLELLMSQHQKNALFSLEEVIVTDQKAREEAYNI